MAKIQEHFDRDSKTYVPISIISWNYKQRDKPEMKTPRPSRTGVKLWHRKLFAKSMTRRHTHIESQDCYLEDLFWQEYRRLSVHSIKEATELYRILYTSSLQCIAKSTTLYCWEVSCAEVLRSRCVVLYPIQNLHTVHSTTHRLLRTSATTPSAEHHMR
jgi:hypothetical protein